ncbi:MAG: arginine--tRNA ligase, partial [Clostridia bacterium]|nr:arginine--tRNA ligase [Clostridia bacterium]
LHFDRWFKVCEYMGRPYASNLKHIAYGTYSMPTGKIGSRFGKQALVRDMLDQAISKAHDIVTTRGTKVDDIDSLSKAIGVGCIVFGVLKSEKIKDSVFDMDAALNFEGETSPYMQYTHARCCSILEKAGVSDISWSDSELDSIDNVDTFELVKHLNNFEKVVLDAAKNYEPCLISRYLLNLCSLFNKFYNSYRIIENDMVVTTRLAVVSVTKKVLCKGLKLLGIEPITKM